MVKLQSLPANKKMKSADQPALDCPFNDDVLVEIFKRLSVKTLGRLRCVCKSWNSIIASPSLIAYHRRHQNSSTSMPIHKPCILLRRWRIVFGYLCAFYDPDQEGPLDQSTMFVTLPFNCFAFRAHRQQLMFVDAIHGVVCLTLSCELPPTVLFNPTMGKFVEIPHSPFASDGYAHSLGFGFNSIKDDFWLIRLCLPIHKWMPLVYEVFSAKQGIWRKVVVGRRKIKPIKVVSYASFFLDGTIHWIVSESASNGQNKKKDYRLYSLLMFHCELEEFKEMAMPESFNRWGSKLPIEMKPAIFKFRGMLALMFSNHDLWVMEEYGVTSTWKILHFNEGLNESDGLVLEESMFLINVQRPMAEEQAIKEGKVYYKICGPAIWPWSG